MVQTHQCFLNSPLSVVASTCYDETEFNSIINVFQGSDCRSLSCIGVVDTVETDCQTKAVFEFLAEPSITYYILVQGYNSGKGNFKLGLNISTNYFSMIDSQLDLAIFEQIPDVVSYGLVNSKLNIQAVFGDEAAIESVQVTFDGPPRSYCEEFPPYSVFWDTEGDFFDAEPSIPIGLHTVSATAYAQAGCSGTVGASMTKNFEVIGCSVQYAVYDTVTSLPVYFLFGDDSFSLTIDPIPCDVNIKVFAYCGFLIVSVQIELRNTVTDRVVASKTEVTNPYFLFGKMTEMIFLLAPWSWFVHCLGNN